MLRQKQWPTKQLGLAITSTQSTCQTIGHYRNVRGLGKSMIVFRLFEKLRYSNERSTIFQSLYHEQKYLEEENGKMVALQISPKIEFVWIGQTGQKIIRVCMEFCNFCKVPHLDNLPQKTLKLGRVAFHSLPVTFQF